MRSIIFILLLINGTNCFAQLEYRNTVDLPEVSKTELYKRALYWVTEEFRSANDVIQLKEEDNGKIVAKGALPYTAAAFKPGTCYSGWFRFTFLFDCKDGKYKYEINRISHETYPNWKQCECNDLVNVPRALRKKLPKVKQDAEALFQDFVKQFEADMSKPKETTW